MCVSVCVCSVESDVFNVMEKDFSVKLTASQEEVKEGEPFSLTCTAPPGNFYIQEWLHPSKEVREFYFPFPPMHCPTTPRFFFMYLLKRRSSKSSKSKALLSVGSLFCSGLLFLCSVSVCEAK